MAEHSAIEWTDATWNPITGCSVVSPGCAKCYAMRLAGGRLRKHPSREGLTVPSKAGPVWNGKVRLNEGMLTDPLHWTRPRRIFVCAHGDLFHEAVPAAWIDKVFAVMALCPQHTFQVLTKRSARMRAYVNALLQKQACMASNAVGLITEAYGKVPTGTIYDAFTRGDPAGRAPWLPLPNVWLGVSAEGQLRHDQRVPDLEATPAAVRFLSAEPLLGAIGKLSPNLDWVIVGGESGPGARPMHPDWVRNLRSQCEVGSIPFFFKQWGSWVEVAPDEPVRVVDWDDEDETHLIEPRDRFLSAGGHLVDDSSVAIAGVPYRLMRPVGKKAAGRMLDGRTFSEMPAVAS